MCNVTIKIVTKTITNRIKIILPDIIDEEQSDFVKGRLIIDNALVAMECFHWLKKKDKGKKGEMGLKFDMSKAYDRLEWKFVTNTLSTTGFPIFMVNLMGWCISTMKYPILVNGNPSKDFIPAMGLRQEDPLSPYLFVICADVLSRILKKENMNHNLHGLRIPRKAPVISHMFFVDYSLMFARAITTEADQILQVLHRYQAASGQVVNLNKSEVSFSKNVSV